MTFLAAALAILAAPATAAQPAAAPKQPAAGPTLAGATLAAGTPMAAVFERMPAEQRLYIGPDWAESGKIFQSVIDGGKPSITALVGLLVEPAKMKPGEMEDYKVRWVIHGVAVLAAKNGEKDRRMVTDALLTALKPDMPKMIQAFVIQELQWAGSKDIAPRLAAYLQDDVLYDYATRALVGYGDTADTLRPALDSAKGRPRIAIMQALGTLRDVKSVEAIAKVAASDADRDTRIAALDALGNIGDTASADTLLAAAQSAKEQWEKTKACEDALVAAKRLVEAGDKKASANIYKTLWTSPAVAAERHVRIAALEGLAQVTGDMTEILAAMKSDDRQVRAAAIEIAAAAPGAEATKVCLAALENATTPPERINLVAMLGNRRDAAALPAVLKTLKDSDEGVRMASANAVAMIGGPEAADALIAQIASTAGRDRDVAASALGRMAGPQASAATAAALAEQTDAGVRVALVTALAARRALDQAEAVAAATADADLGVRVAAIRALGTIGGQEQLPGLVKIVAQSKDAKEIDAARDALVAATGRGMADRVAELAVPAFAAAASPNMIAMMRVLGSTARPDAMKAVLGQAASTDGGVKDNAIRTLAEWKTKDAAAPLVEVAQAAANPTQKILALRGAIRLTSAASPDRSMTPEEKMKVLAAAMKLADRPEEKREVLASLGAIPNVAALRLAAASLDDAAVKEEAAAGVVRIAEPIAAENPQAVRDPLEKILKVSENAGVRAAAQKTLNSLAKP